MSQMICGKAGQCIDECPHKQPHELRMGCDHICPQHAGLQGMCNEHTERSANAKGEPKRRGAI